MSIYILSQQLMLAFFVTLLMNMCYRRGGACSSNGCIGDRLINKMVIELNRTINHHPKVEVYY